MDQPADPDYDTALATVTAEISRTDSKASTLLAAISLPLAALVAITPTRHLATAAAAQEKILAVLDECRDPLGLEVGYLHLDQIEQMTRVTRKTVENTLSRLAKSGDILRKPDTAGEYGLPLVRSAS